MQMGEVFSIPEKKETKPQKVLSQKKYSLRRAVAMRLKLHKREVEEDESDIGQTERDTKAGNINPNDYQYPFENLVLEGGGSKGNAYIGLIQVLDEVGILPQIKRFAGSSVGAMTAMYLAAGYSAEELKIFLGPKLLALSKDSHFLCYLPNILRGYGLHPGQRAYNWFGDRLKEKLGDPDITFKQLYKMKQIELCVVVANVSYMTEEYCHHKTTPDMPIRLAVRISTAFPGLYQPVRYGHSGHSSVYVDGGLLCNSPQHVFDGWFLSTLPGDNLFERLDTLNAKTTNSWKERFDGFNEKTLGTILFSTSDNDVDRTSIEAKYGKRKWVLPKTKLAKQWAQSELKHWRLQKEYKSFVKAMETFFRVLEKYDKDRNTSISRDEFETFLSDEEFTDRIREILFGDMTSQEMFDTLDVNGDGEIDLTELTDFAQTSGVHLIQLFHANLKEDVNDVLSFGKVCLSTLVDNNKRIFQKERDIERLIGINTGYVGVDSELEEEDQNFLIMSGRESCYKFLQYYALDKDLKKKELKEEPGEDKEATNSAPTESGDQEEGN